MINSQRILHALVDDSADQSFNFRESKELNKNQNNENGCNHFLEMISNSILYIVPFQKI